MRTYHYPNCNQSIKSHNGLPAEPVDLPSGCCLARLLVLCPASHPAAHLAQGSPTLCWNMLQLLLKPCCSKLHLINPAELNSWGPTLIPTATNQLSPTMVFLQNLLVCHQVVALRDFWCFAQLLTRLLTWPKAVRLYVETCCNCFWNHVVLSFISSIPQD